MANQANFIINLDGNPSIVIRINENIDDNLFIYPMTFIFYSLYTLHANIATTFI